MMQMKDPYLDHDGKPDADHHGQWLMEPEQLKLVFDTYWDAEWQIHIHVNGDLGLEVLLDIIEEAQRRKPRNDHRTVIVHFANSTEEQVERIASLGAIVISTVHGVSAQSGLMRWCALHLCFDEVFHFRFILIYRCVQATQC